MTKRTFEERINELKATKRKLTDMTIASGEQWIGTLSNAEPEEFAIGARKTGERESRTRQPSEPSEGNEQHSPETTMTFLMFSLSRKILRNHIFRNTPNVFSDMMNVLKGSKV